MDTISLRKYGGNAVALKEIGETESYLDSICMEG
jgi:hypothetical protein